jgi:hypothetical protein
VTVLSGATWLAWRNNRQAAVIGGVLASGAAAALVVVAILETAEETAVPTGSVHTMGHAFEALLAGAPAVAGVFMGAPLLSADFDRGTHLLTWTQGMTRRRWAAANLSLLMGLSALAAAVMAVGAQIWITHLPKNPYNSTWEIYDLQAPVVFSYVLFAVALGAATGAALRRTVPAMAATLGIFIAVRVAFVALLRPHPATNNSGSCWGCQLCRAAGCRLRRHDLPRFASEAPGPGPPHRPEYSDQPCLPASCSLLADAGARGRDLRGLGVSTLGRRPQVRDPRRLTLPVNGVTPWCRPGVATIRSGWCPRDP